tara:strand:- start:2453 stop:2989 length:537 start_codon:yes stop_codon:yes gene_type:complete
MNRYEFEDLISEYIENSLSLKKRKEFEKYLKEHSKAQILVDEVRSTINEIKNIKQVQVSENFNERLLKRINNDKLNNRFNLEKQKTYFGFTPIYASLMTGLIVSFLIVSLNFFGPEKNSITPNKFYVNDPISKSSKPITNIVDPQSNNIEENKDDSLNQKSLNSPKLDFTKRMKLVND